LLQNSVAIAPHPSADPQVVLLSPGVEAIVAWSSIRIDEIANGDRRSDKAALIIKNRAMLS